jgi:uncharacterized protein YeaO (DUF488 family)
MIFTSYYANPALRKFKGIRIQISTSKPFWHKVDTSIEALYPGWELVKGHKEGTLNDEEYTKKYIKHLDSLNWDGILKYLQSNDCILLCWCRKDAFCHRHILRHYLRDKFNLEIKEL